MKKEKVAEIITKGITILLCYNLPLFLEKKLGFNFVFGDYYHGFIAGLIAGIMLNAINGMYKSK